MAKAKPDPGAADATPQKGGGKGKLLLVLPLLLGAACAGLWFTGVLPGLLGHGGHKPAAHTSVSAPPAFVDLPEMLTNLNMPGKRPAYVKLHAKLEVQAGGAEAITAAMPRLIDLFQTYLRDMHPEELRGSLGTYRLREELLARANVAVAPAHVSDVLFEELIIE